MSDWNMLVSLRLQVESPLWQRLGMLRLGAAEEPAPRGVEQRLNQAQESF
jgi:hypothetical protein